ncbi:MAG: hypothetical protein IKA77_04445 [Clostridia bacterium]|nr:hypothetical protein [Clostridia bacterium]
MAKCKACGEFNPEGSRFCAKCGSSMADDNAVIAEALKEAQKDFDRDSMATLDKSRITYVVRFAVASIVSINPSVPVVASLVPVANTLTLLSALIKAQSSTLNKRLWLHRYPSPLPSNP